MCNKISSCYSNTDGKKSHPLNGFWRKSSVACEGAFCYSIKGTKGTALERSDIDIAVSGVGEFDALLEEVEDFVYSRSSGYGYMREWIIVGGHQAVWTKNLEEDCQKIIRDYIDKLYEFRNWVHRALIEDQEGEEK